MEPEERETPPGAQVETLAYESPAVIDRIEIAAGLTPVLPS